MKENKKILLENIFSFSVIQAFNYIIPFITFPYLINVLGVEKFGLINFATAFVGYFILIVEYGFNISAVKLISINRNNYLKLSEIVSSIVALKIVLFVISTTIFLITLSFINIFKDERILFISTYLSVLGNLFLPIWFYQGVEKSKYVAIINFITKIIWVITIFYFIRNSNDYIKATLLTSLNSIISGIILFYIMIKKFNIRILLPNKILFKEIFIDSGIIFLSTCSISLYTISNTFILGLLTNNQIVGYYTAADKIKTAVQNMLLPFTQSMFPRASLLLNESIKKGKIFILKSLKYVGSFSFLISLTLFLLSEKIVYIIIGQNFQRTVNVLKIISFLPFIIYLSNLFGIQTMINLNYKKQFTYIITVAALINLSLTFLFVPKFYEIGSAISVLITELFVTISFIVYLIMKGFFSDEI